MPQKILKTQTEFHFPKIDTNNISIIISTPSKIINLPTSFPVLHPTLPWPYLVAHNLKDLYNFTYSTYIATSVYIHTHLFVFCFKFSSVFFAVWGLHMAPFFYSIPKLNQGLHVYQFLWYGAWYIDYTLPQYTKVDWSFVNPTKGDLCVFYYLSKAERIKNDIYDSVRSEMVTLIVEWLVWIVLWLRIGFERERF